MDETLGYFVQFGIFWDALQEYFNHSLTDNDFFKVSYTAKANITFK